MVVDWRLIGGGLMDPVASSEEFPEVLRGSIRQDHEGRFYEDFYRSGCL